MNSENSKLGRANAGFAMATGITVVFSTALAWAKDAYKPLNNLMNDVAWHNWIAHGLADLILFIGLGLIFSNANMAERIAPNRLITFLVAAVVVAGAGLFVWYALF
ncbi:MAG TPA: hypothetical protein VKR82_06015 [Candidatus Acidoferrales bacterium]|nr:hypothetical protein [Candidatus Acidoferrales bacterium]